MTKPRFCWRLLACGSFVSSHGSSAGMRFLTRLAPSSRSGRHVGLDCRWRGVSSAENWPGGVFRQARPASLARGGCVSNRSLLPLAATIPAEAIAHAITRFERGLISRHPLFNRFVHRLSGCVSCPTVCQSVSHAPRDACGVGGPNPVGCSSDPMDPFHFRKR